MSGLSSSPSVWVGYCLSALTFPGNASWGRLLRIIEVRVLLLGVCVCVCVCVCVSGGAFTTMKRRQSQV